MIKVKYMFIYVLGRKTKHKYADSPMSRMISVSDLKLEQGVWGILWIYEVGRRV